MRHTRPHTIGKRIPLFNDTDCSSKSPLPTWRRYDWMSIFAGHVITQGATQSALWSEEAAPDVFFYNSQVLECWCILPYLP